MCPEYAKAQHVRMYSSCFKINFFTKSQVEQVERGVVGSCSKVLREERWSLAGKTALVTGGSGWETLETKREERTERKGGEKILPA